MIQHRLRVVVVTIAVLVAAPAAAAPTPVPLRSIADILALPADEVAKRRPASIEGLVTYCAKHQSSLVVEADGDAIYVSALSTAVHAGPGPIPPIEPGCLVEIEGEVIPGGYSPTLLPRRIRVSGRRPLPPAAAADLARLFRGGDIGRRVIVEGVVQGFTRTKGDRLTLAIDTGVGLLPVEIVGPLVDPPADQLVDAAIRATAFVSAIRNSRGQFIAPKARVVDPADITVLLPAPTDPFAGETTPLGMLARFQPRPRSSHRVRTEGVVSYAAPGLLYVAANDAGVRVELLASDSDAAGDGEHFTAGDRVQVAGFIDMSRRIAQLTGAVARRVASGPPPQPRPLAVAEVFRLAEDFRTMAWITEPGSYDGQLVRCRGVVESVEPRADRLVVALAAENARWFAEFGPPTATAAALLKVGSEVDIAGILVTDIDAQQLNGLLLNQPTTERVRVLARDAADIAIVRPVSWWTRSRLLAVLAGVSSALVVAVGLAGLLGREVRRKAAALATTLQWQREATIEFETALRERNRLAANLHDTVLQTVTGLGFQLQVCQVEAERQGELPAHRLEVAQRMVTHAVEQLRGTVWALHSPLATGESLRAALEQRIAQLCEGHETPVRCRFAGIERPLPEAVAANLLLVAQEAVANALLHAAAAAIEVSVAFAETTVTVVVRDDGRGFAAGDHPGPLQGHFGLEGMLDRMQAVGGSCTVESRPGSGTTVTAVAPCPDREDDLSDRAGAEAAGRGSMAP